MKNLRLVASAALIIAAVVVAALAYSPKETQQQSCGTYRSDKIVRINSNQVDAEVAQTPAEKEKGLSGRPCIERDQGMLFIFNKPGHYAFWMKDMLFSIDIVWIDADHKVVGLEIGVTPSTYPDSFINKDQPAQYVLELQANRAKDLKVNLGTLINF